MSYVPPTMIPIFDANCVHVGWFDGTHVFDSDVDWIGYVGKGNVFTSAMSGDWLAPLHEGSFLDRQGRPVAWLQGTVPQGGLTPSAPVRAVRPLRPRKPLRPRTPLFPTRPLTPSCGWSEVAWLEWTGRAPRPEPAAAADVDVLVFEPLDARGFDAFFDYLDEHLADNGRDGAYFQPLSVADSRLPPAKAQAFVDGLKADVPASGWRRAWVARDASGAIVGHVDLRGHPDRFTEHRCLLGMGVRRDQRRRGLGRRLLAHAAQWAAAETALQWIDLRVLANNEAAVALYMDAGFDMLGGTKDRYVIDGRSLGEMAMARRVAR